MKAFTDTKIAKFFRFLKYNKYWDKTIIALFLSAHYRLQIKFRKPDKLRRNWGVEGEETPIDELSKEEYRYVYRVAYAVDKVCTHTPYESKCLVRALCARKMLVHKGIPCTMYLGCGYDENKKMVAHAWLRAGNVYVTGGNGSQYAIVDKFRS